MKLQYYKSVVHPLGCLRATVSRERSTGIYDSSLPPRLVCTNNECLNMAGPLSPLCTTSKTLASKIFSNYYSEFMYGELTSYEEQAFYAMRDTLECWEDFVATYYKRAIDGLTDQRRDRIYQKTFLLRLPYMRWMTAGEQAPRKIIEAIQYRIRRKRQADECLF